MRNDLPDQSFADGRGRLYCELQGVVETNNDLQSRSLGLGATGLVDCTQGRDRGPEPDDRIPSPCQ